MRRVTATFPTIKVFGMALKGGLVQRVCTSPLLSIEPYTWIARIFSAIHCMHSAAHSGRWCGGPAAAVRFKQRPKLVSYIRFNHHGVVLCCTL